MSNDSPSQEKSAVIEAIQAHEEFIQHIEQGSSRIRGLSVITIAVSVLLLGAYISQLLLPYLTGGNIQTVNLTDPALEGTEIVLSALTLLWLYVGLRDFLFTRRMSKVIGEIRLLERDVEKRIAGQ
jgi:hypothetical protein